MANFKRSKNLAIGWKDPSALVDPGTGKTLLLKRLQKANVPFSISGSDFVNLVGVGASK